MSLCTDFGRYDRAAVIERAKLHHREMEWAAALGKAYREASTELRERFNRHTTVPAVAIRKVAHV